MVGVMVPIALEGGRGDRRSHQREASSVRRTSCASHVKPLLKKNSRSRLRTFQVSIQLEAGEEQPRPQLIKRGSTSKLVLPWDPVVAQQVQQARRQSGARPSAVQYNTVQPSTVQYNTVQPGTVQYNTVQYNTVQPGTVQYSAVESGARPSSGFTQFQLEALAEHNIYRERHGVQLLELRTELCQSAQQYADRLASSDQFQHSGDSMYGENLYWGWTSEPGWVPGGGEAVHSWYEEGATYDFTREPPPDTPAGHFTQLVWAGSTAMGVGLTAVPARPGKWVVVVKYDPPGNWLGRYTMNVYRPTNTRL